MLLILSNDVELNPGPKKNSSKCNFSIAHGNLNSIAAQTFVKLSQLEAYNTMHSYDLICLSETWLDSTTSIDSNDLSVKGYDLHRVDDPNNVNKGEVCVYSKETLAVHFLQAKLDQCIVREVTFKNKKKGHVISLYCIDHRHKLQINMLISFSYLRNFCKIFLNLSVPLF